MKKIKLVLFSLLVLLVSLVFIQSSFANSDNFISAIEGASIRTKTENSLQGLRFSGKVASSHYDKEHGFYVAYGKTTVASLKEAILLNEQNPIINGKTVFKVIVPGVKENGEFSVVLTGIPSNGYFDDISVIPFVIDGFDLKFVETPITRSVASVALKMANDGFDISTITEVNAILNSSKKHAYQFPSGDIELTSNLLENDYLKLKEEFIKDWNKKFNTSFDDIKKEDFYLSSTLGLTDPISTNINISNSNLYKFFNDFKLKQKWGWFLGYLNYNNNIEEVETQIEALLNDGTFDDSNLYHAVNLIYSIYNFFNNDYYISDYETIDFTISDRYLTIKYFNGSIYIDLDNTLLYEVGDLCVLPDFLSQDGFIFSGYEYDDVLYSAGNNFTVLEDNLILEAQFAYYTYSIEFYDKTVPYTDLEIDYNIDSVITLPIPEKEGYEFLGWYEDYNFAGENVTKITKGTTGAKTFYAKWEKIIDPINPNEEFSIIFNLNGGSWPIEGAIPGYTNRDVMIKDFLTEFYNFLSPAEISLNDFLHGSGKTSGYDGLYSNYVSDLRELSNKVVVSGSTKFVNQAAYNKWVPLIDLMDEYTGAGNPAQAGQFWSSDYVANLRFKPFILKQNLWGEAKATEINEIVNRIPNPLKVSNPGTPITPPSKFKVTTDDIILPIPIKANDTFLGWYEEFNFSGNKVTTLVKGSSGDKEYYALWNSTEIPIEPDSISFNDSEIELNLNEEVTLNPIVTGLDNYQLVYTVSDSTIISIDANGKIRGLKVGKVEVCVRVKNTIKEACMLVNVVDPNAEPEIIFEYEFIGILENDSLELSYSVINIDEYLITWESSNNLIATVDINGVVTGINKGETTITATILGTNITSTINVIVTDSVTLHITYTFEGTQENTLQLIASIIPLEFDEGVTWQSSNEDVAVVLYDGLVIVKDSGQVTFTATSKFNPNIKQTLILNFEYSEEDGVLLKEIEIEL